MIVIKPEREGSHRMTMLLRPNRALSHKSLRRLAWVLAAVTLATALVGAHQGNVFAPLFALVEAAAVVWALGIAWHAGSKGERITVDERLLEVEAWPGRRLVRFQSGWVRVLLASGGNRRRLLLASHGRELEIGAFLGDEERTELRGKLELLLAQVTAPGHMQVNNGSDPGPEGFKT